MPKRTMIFALQKILSQQKKKNNYDFIEQSFHDIFQTEIFSNNLQFKEKIKEYEHFIHFKAF